MALTFNAINELREAVSQRLINLDFRHTGDAPFKSSIQTIISSPDVRVVRWTHTPGSTYRDSHHTKDGDTSCSLIYPVNCSITVTHLDRDQRLARGQPALLRHDAVGEIGSKSGCSYIALILSPSVLTHSLFGDNLLSAGRWPHDLRSIRLLRAYVSLLSTQSVLEHGDPEALAARHLVEIVRLLATEAQGRVTETNDTSISHSRMEVAMAFIKGKFRDPNLSIKSVASAQRISPRYLHKVLERESINFTKCLNAMRLDAGYAALAAGVKLPISNIALDSGFSDVAHFNRMFKQRFGVTPSSVRAIGSETTLADAGKLDDRHPRSA